jgi:hypothetical protein
MATTQDRQEPVINLRVLALYDTNYKTHVAHCLETGSVVTADTKEVLKKMIQELLEDEISYALQTKNIANLFSSPAPFDLWLQWQEAAKHREPDVIELKIEDPAHGRNREVETEVRVAAA